MTLHERIKYGYKLDDLELTTELLNERDSGGDTVWHSAACMGALMNIPQHLFTKDAMNQKNGETVWHTAALYGSLQHIPQHLFTEEALNEEDERGNNVWHVIATVESAHYKAFPKNLEDVPFRNRLQDIPQHLIVPNLLKMKNRAQKSLFNTKDRKYIKKVLQLPAKLNGFIKNNPNLAKDLEFRDPRLKLIEASKTALIFKFEGTEEQVILNNDGAAINDKNFNTLNNAVSFIELNHPVEQSISLPANKAETVENFVL